MRQIILNMLPRSLRLRVKSITNKYRTWKAYSTDIKRYYKYSNTYSSELKSERLLAVIISRYHVIEKGLSMPEMRLGFGHDALLDLIKLCDSYAAHFNVHNDQFQHALSVISEYKQEHQKAGFKLEKDINDAIEKILKSYKPISCSQIDCTSEDYFKFREANFAQFSTSRHSVRNYEGKVPVETIKQAIQLAQNAPSSCNRQSSRVYIVDNKETVNDVLALQNGNRGFGHLSDKVLVLTSEIGSFGRLPERNQMFVDGGIYAMNLLYALHYYEVGACALNWCSKNEEDVKLRKLLGIKPSEAVILVITCGKLPPTFKVAISPRTDVSNIITKV